MGDLGWGRRLRAAVVTAAVLGAGSLALAPGAAAGTAVGDATTAAVAAATASGFRVAVAVTDTTTGTTSVAGEADAAFPSESIVKVLIAARLLVDGRMTGGTETAAAAMISSSDDSAADSLWGAVGGPDVVTWAAQRYGVTGLGEPSEWGWWGNTKVSATALSTLYSALLADPAVGPWLTAQMAASTPRADDGTDQTFGFGSLVAGGAAVKQGWGGDDDSQSTENLLSTGYLDDHRFAVAVIVQDPDGGSFSSVVPTVDAVAAAVETDTTATLAASQAAAAAAAAQAATPAPTATDEVVPKPGRITAAAVGGASGPIATGAWWPNVLIALGAVTVLGAGTAVVSVVSRRNGARPSS